ncbi:GntR family transcriptional regulator [Microbacterium album]|uniref:GntR family transcriptional regulator n=1 Tax=Microbacterium album TaxID=2053191 RepID=A0A917MMS2_9MICO|nr:GntR family transcriptional regulator [Microbacterium album]GGH36763.1 GntR family transcriptional regulator [Microbacterium album]
MKQSRAEMLRDLIEQEIVTGAFAPGQRLDEVMLAERFGVSRTPVREALRQLAATELVEIKPHRGVFVRVIPIPEMLNMFEVMSELEGMCARLAARRRTEEQLRELDEARAECEATLATGDADEYYYANERFHSLLYAASGNPFLARMASSLQTRLKPFRRLQLRVPGRMGSSSDEHAAIVDAVRSGDAAEAERLAGSHVTVQGDRFSDFLAAVAMPLASA